MYLQPLCGREAQLKLLDLIKMKHSADFVKLIETCRLDQEILINYLIQFSVCFVSTIESINSNNTSDLMIFLHTRFPIIDIPCSNWCQFRKLNRHLLCIIADWAAKIHISVKRGYNLNLWKNHWQIYKMNEYFRKN